MENNVNSYAHEHCEIVNVLCDKMHKTDGKCFQYVFKIQDERNIPLHLLKAGYR